jgi:hypothetical protein
MLTIGLCGLYVNVDYRSMLTIGLCGLYVNVDYRSMLTIGLCGLTLTYNPHRPIVNIDL